MCAFMLFPSMSVLILLRRSGPYDSYFQLRKDIIGASSHVAAFGELWLMCKKLLTCPDSTCKTRLCRQHCKYRGLLCTPPFHFFSQP